MSDFFQTEIHGKVLLARISFEKTLNCLNDDILKEMSDTLRLFNRN